MTKQGVSFDDAGRVADAVARVDAFSRWYRWHGHWIYGTRKEALRTWRERGIEGLPDYSEMAGGLLSSEAAHA